MALKLLISGNDLNMGDFHERRTSPARCTLRRGLQTAGFVLSLACLGVPPALGAEGGAEGGAEDTAAVASKPGPRVLGWAERARIYPGNLPVQAKLDTGANTSSLNADAYELFDRGGKQWVRFTVSNRAGAKRAYEFETVRISKIKNLHGATKSRPVVKIGVCIGDIYKIAEVNLSQRTGFIYKLLLGRRFLENLVIVNPARKFTQDSSCNNKAVK